MTRRQPVLSFVEGQGAKSSLINDMLVLSLSK